MPFTPSHAAAALLFTRTPLIPAAIVAGSVAPDLPYYVPVPVARELTHEPLGVVTIDLVIALVAFLAWNFVLRAPVIDLSPAWLRLRLPARPALSSARDRRPLVVVILVLLASLVVGSATHLAWDVFTHPGPVVDGLPLLGVQAGPLVVHKWLQHASSIAGLAVIAAYTVRWVRRTPQRAETAPAAEAPASRRVVSDRMRRAAWISVAAVFVVAAGVGWLIAQAAQRSEGLDFVLLDPGIVFQTARVCVGAALAASVALCLAWYLYQRDRMTATTLPRTSA